MGFNVLSLVLSVVAVAASTWGVRLQISRARADSDLAMTTDLILTHVRDPQFQRDQLWVLNGLSAEHGPENGLEGLPEPANLRAWNVGIVYETVSIMLRFELTNPVILMSLAQHRIVKTWEALEPYVAVERERRGRVVFPFFEDAYVAAKAADPSLLYASLGLRKADGSPRVPDGRAGGAPWRAPGRGRGIGGRRSSPTRPTRLTRRRTPGF
ncbi:hypothetical protein [Streptomyces sp. NPDC050504]|uniref:hypothetical protein n=1 Tax=Streptomyces sp. NPDC050504 TaxID=3365618 RepID=UPI0037BB0B4B